MAGRQEIFYRSLADEILLEHPNGEQIGEIARYHEGKNYDDIEKAVADVRAKVDMRIKPHAATRLLSEKLQEIVDIDTTAYHLDFVRKMANVFRAPAVAVRG